MQVIWGGMAPDMVTRRLAAIVAVDVVGFSRLMGADEEGTLAQLKAHRAVTDPLVDKFGGRSLAAGQERSAAARTKLGRNK